MLEEMKMNNEIRIFENEQFGKVRTLLIDGQPWFVGKDVAEALGYTNSRKALIDHVDEEDKGVTKRDTLGGNQKLTIINESGLYCLIIKSKLEDSNAGSLPKFSRQSGIRCLSYRRSIGTGYGRHFRSGKTFHRT
jgi:prophage antirepressor-like protein